jgi:hypothetical protein
MRGNHARAKKDDAVLMDKIGGLYNNFPAGFLDFVRAYPPEGYYEKIYRSRSRFRLSVIAVPDGGSISVRVVSVSRAMVM